MLLGVILARESFERSKVMTTSTPTAVLLPGRTYIGRLNDPPSCTCRDMVSSVEVEKAISGPVKVAARFVIS